MTPEMPPRSGSTPPVNSWTEWDPLEEVIVGVLDGAVALTFEVGFEAVTPMEDRERSRQYHSAHAGKPRGKLPG